ncbi:hypothetical protein M569_06978 [Genlisea aurea]|uniref:Hexosyltransferase n=1 Tax=Genlisea aurea TaxID=192259 RepID=S8CKS5_9LAMI|nr:hypothetical protein M569_06978 [Genlisea aurea]
MKFWFYENRYGDAAVQVLNIDDHNGAAASPLQLSLPDEFRISFHEVDKLSTVRVRTQYVSVFSQSHYLLPDIFRSLEKAVVLDDDVIVQKDLSDLWNLDMAGKAVAAVQSCDLNFDIGEKKSSCIWNSGLNVVDFSSWRAQNISDNYKRSVHEVSICIRKSLYLRRRN